MKKRTNIFDSEVNKKLKAFDLLKAEEAANEVAKFSLKMFKNTNDSMWLNKQNTYLIIANNLKAEISKLANG